MFSAETYTAKEKMAKTGQNCQFCNISYDDEYIIWQFCNRIYCYAIKEIRRIT